MYHRHRYQFNAGIAGVGTTAVFTILLYALTKWHVYGCWLIGVNIVTFILFGVDKSLAKAGSARIPESSLHLVTLLGGAIGQLLGRSVFRHKTDVKKHPLFLVVPLVSLALHAGLVFFFFFR